MLTISRLFFLISCSCLLALTACTPKYDWREVHGTDAQFVVLMPAKPTTFARPIKLGDHQTTMTMMAAEVNGVTFAIGSATLPDAEQARRALPIMQMAMVNNINGKITSQKNAADRSTLEVDATGLSPAQGNKQPLRLVARFIARDKQVLQVMVIGPAKAMPQDALDTYFDGFKLQ